MTHSIVDVFELWFTIVLIPIYYPISMQRTVDERTPMWLPYFDWWENPAHLDRNGCAHARVNGVPALGYVSQQSQILPLPVRATLISVPDWVPMCPPRNRVFWYLPPHLSIMPHVFLLLFPSLSLRYESRGLHRGTVSSEFKIDEIC